MLLQSLCTHAYVNCYIYTCIGLDEVVCITRPMTGCPPNEHQCGTSNDCIPLGRICDGFRDCFNGEDEINCSKYLM